MKCLTIVSSSLKYDNLYIRKEKKVAVKAHLSHRKYAIYANG